MCSSDLVPWGAENAQIGGGSTNSAYGVYDYLYTHGYGAAWVCCTIW